METQPRPAIMCLAKDYGIKGVLVYLRLKLGFTNGFSFPKVSHPIYLRTNSSDIPTFQGVFTYKEYEVDLKFDPQNIIDAGANIGLAAIYFANRYPKSRIVSIEPEKSNFSVLERNTRDYGNIRPIKNALSKQSRQVINIVDNGHGNWGFITESIEMSQGKNVADFAETITIEDIMKQHDMEYIDILKVDIEGAEKEVFEGNYQYWLPKTRCLMVELHDRLTPGSSKMVFKAISEYEFAYTQSGENLVFINLDKKLQATEIGSV